MIFVNLHKIPALERNAGFTLIELLVVIGIVGVLAGVTLSIINPKKQQQVAQDGVRMSNLKKYALGIEAYANANGKYPQKIDDADANGKPDNDEIATFISKIPTDQLTSGVEYNYSTCPGQNSFMVGVPKASNSTACYKYYSCWGQIREEAPCGTTMDCTSGCLAAVPTTAPTPAATPISPAWTCGHPFDVNHVVGTVAPESKKVSYGTTLFTLTDYGETKDKCFITQNLGADRQALSAYDSSEASAGWYFQYNRTQGYKHDGTTMTPDRWSLSVGDPCSLEFGADWRTSGVRELSSAAATGGVTPTGAWDSALRLHAAGYITHNYPVYSLQERGHQGYFWGDWWVPNSSAWFFTSFGPLGSAVSYGDIAFGFSIRCVRDM